MENIAGSGTTSRLREDGRGILILVLGILSIIILGPIGGIPAWIMGRNDLKKIEAGIIPYTEKTATKAGMILGIIGTFLVFVVIILGILTVVGINIILQ